MNTSLWRLVGTIQPQVWEVKREMLKNWRASRGLLYGSGVWPLFCGYRNNVRDRNPDMNVVEVCLVGKYRMSGMLSESLWVFQGNHKREKAKDDQHKWDINSWPPTNTIFFEKVTDWKTTLVNTEDALPGCVKDVENTLVSVPGRKGHTHT